MPGLADPHTDLVFAGSRESEFALRIQGKIYQEIAATGGGINAPVAANRKANKKERKAAARKAIDRMLFAGTTTVEAESGYGVELEAELKMLEGGAPERLSITHTGAAHPSSPNCTQDPCMSSARTFLPLPAL